MESPILPMWNDALARARAFESQGVTLAFPARSRSGVRDVDGVVVFAIAAALVRHEHCGFSCLLWMPAAASLDSACRAETLEHCRLAMRQGLAEGFLVYDAESAPHGAAHCIETVALRVVKAGREYWAKWGFAPHAQLPEQYVAAKRVRL